MFLSRMSRFQSIYFVNVQDRYSPVLVQIGCSFTTSYVQVWSGFSPVLVRFIEESTKAGFDTGRFYVKMAEMYKLF